MPRCLVTGMIDALCGLTGDDFTQMALDLLPRGLAWPREPGTVLEKFWSVPGDRMSDLHQYGCTFLNQESFPCSAVQLLSDWERVLGLPDECTPSGQSLAERQQAVCQKLTARGGQTKAYFVAIAAAAGYSIEIIEHFPSRVGRAQAGCGTTGNCPYWWTVRVFGLTVTQARTGCATVCQPFCSIPDFDALRCLILRAAPAHTVVTFLLDME